VGLAVLGASVVGVVAAPPISAASTPASVTPAQRATHPRTWRSIAEGNSMTTCGVKTDLSAWCWGWDGEAEVGDQTTGGRTGMRLRPFHVPGKWRSLKTEGKTTCGVRTDNTGWCWGYDFSGQVGDGGRGNKQHVHKMRTRLPGEWKSISLSQSGATCGLKLNGTGWCWGAIGLPGHPGGVRTPHQIAGTWDRLILADDQLVCGVKPDDTAWCWGTFGVDGSGGTSLTPVELSGTWTSLSIDSGTICGIQTDGTGWCWGTNDFGQVGNGSKSAFVSSPFQLPGLWASLGSGRATTCGVQTDGTGWCWGINTRAQVGNGSTSSAVLTPSQLAGVWVRIAAATEYGPGNTTCGVRASGAGYCWGDDSFGQVGDHQLGTSTKRVTSLPSRVRGSWATLRSYTGTTCGLRPDRTAVCWGDDSLGAVGDGTRGKTVTDHGIRQPHVHFGLYTER
jgi:alpha-tubulin suppressor-like RCC1 family protein